MAVTTVSVTVWAVSQKNITGGGTITKGGGGLVGVTDDISALVSAGKQINAGQVTLLDNFANPQNIQDFDSFNIGDIELDDDGFVNVYFTITNQSSAPISAAVTLTGETNGSFTAGGVTAVKYTAVFAEGKCETVGSVLYVINTALDNYQGSTEDGRTFTAAEDYLEYYGITAYSRTDGLQISQNETKTLVIRYTIGDLKGTFNMGISLDFGILAK
jgi:hypothetical protein